jgi:hypothetical protein
MYDCNHHKAAAFAPLLPDHKYDMKRQVPRQRQVQRQQQVDWTREPLLHWTREPLLHWTGEPLLHSALFHYARQQADPNA